MCAPPGRRSRIPKTTELVTLFDVRARALARPPWQQARGWPRGAERNSGHVTWDVTGGRSVQSPRTPSSFRVPGLRHFLSAVSSMVLIHAKTEIQWYTNQDRAGCDIHTCKCLAQPLSTVRRGVTLRSVPRPVKSGPASAARHMHLRLSGTLRHHRRTAPLMCGHKKGRRIDDRSSHERRRSHGRSANGVPQPPGPGRTSTSSAHITIRPAAPGRRATTSTNIQFLKVAPWCASLIASPSSTQAV